MSIHSIFAGQGQMVTNTASVYVGTFGPTGSGAFVNLPTSANLTIGTSADYTYEFWFYLTGTASFRCAGCLTAAGTSVLRIDSAWSSNFGVSIPFTTLASPTLNKWYHYSASRQAGTVYVHVNGTQYANSATLGSDVTNVNLTGARVGNYNNNVNQEWLGYISQLRISKGARYPFQSSFRPVQQLWSDANTIFLGLNTSSFVDNGPQNLGSLPITVGTNTPTMAANTMIRFV
jgi:hypothetical protein